MTGWRGSWSCSGGGLGGEWLDASGDGREIVLPCLDVLANVTHIKTIMVDGVKIVCMEATVFEVSGSPVVDIAEDLDDEEAVF